MTLRPFSGRAALLIIDVQRGALRSAPELVELPARIAAHVDEHRSRYAIVIASRFRSTPGSAYDRLIQQDLRDEDEVALADGIEERADVIVEASSYSKLTGIALEELAAASVREVHVVGIDTDQCVLATVLTAFDENYDPWVFTDLCGSAAGSDPHEAGLLVLRRAIGDERVVPRP